MPAALVPDHLKSAVTRSCWYDPKIQRTYAALAEHYGTTVTAEPTTEQTAAHEHICGARTYN